MRKMAVAVALAGAVAGACVAQPALAQRRAATEDDALSYIYSAFITRADPGVMASRPSRPLRRSALVIASSTLDASTVPLREFCSAMVDQ